VISRAQIVAASVAGLFLLMPAQALGAADLSVTLSAKPDSIQLASTDVTTVTLTVTNAGSDAATGVKATVGSFEPQLEFVSFNPSQGAVGLLEEGGFIADIGTIASGNAVTVEFRFKADSSGMVTSGAQATTATPESSTANNSASTTVTVIALVPSASPLSFGTQPVGGTGLTQALTLFNGALTPIRVSGIQVVGTDFATAADGCTGATLAPGTACQIDERFTPTGSGDRAAVLTVSSSTEKVSPTVVALTGVGIADKPASLRLEGVPKSLGAKKFKKGFSIKATPDEPAALDVSLLGKARKGALASAFDLQLFSLSLPRAAGTRTIKVKPAARLLGGLRRKTTVRLVVNATDSTGNRTSAARKIIVKPAGKR
jgi:hypothetical protein